MRSEKQTSKSYIVSWCSVSMPVFVSITVVVYELKKYNGETDEQGRCSNLISIVVKKTKLRLNPFGTGLVSVILFYLTEIVLFCLGCPCTYLWLSNYDL